MKSTQHTNGKLAFSSSEIPMRLVALRKYHGLTQKETGELMGVSSYAVCQWENGSIPNSPNRKRLQKMFDEYEPKAGQATTTVERRAATGTDVKPKQFVLHRPEAAPLRFTGYELGSLLLSDNCTLQLYRTAGGLVVWEHEGFVFHGPVDYFIKNWHHSVDAGEVFSFANECGFEIFEDIE